MPPMLPKQWLIHNLIVQPSSNMTFNVIDEDIVILEIYLIKTIPKPL